MTGASGDVLPRHRPLQRPVLDALAPSAHSSELGRLEDALARAGWPFSKRVSLWVDDLVLELEGAA